MTALKMRKWTADPISVMIGLLKKMKWPWLTLNYSEQLTTLIPHNSNTKVQIRFTSNFMKSCLVHLTQTVVIIGHNIIIIITTIIIMPIIKVMVGTLILQQVLRKGSCLLHRMSEEVMLFLITRISSTSNHHLLNLNTNLSTRLHRMTYFNNLRILESTIVHLRSDIRSM